MEIQNNFLWFASNTNILNNDYADKVKQFYGRIGKPFYNLSLDYNSMIKESKFRFLLIDVGDDKVRLDERTFTFFAVDCDENETNPFLRISNFGNRQQSE